MLVAGLVLNQDLGRNISPPPIYVDYFKGLRPKERGREFGRTGIIWEGKTLIHIDYIDELSVLDKNVSKMNKFREVFRVYGERIGSNIILKRLNHLDY